MFNFLIFLLLFNALDLNIQKILCLPSIYQFERTETNLNHAPPLQKSNYDYQADFKDINTKTPQQANS